MSLLSIPRVSHLAIAGSRANAITPAYRGWALQRLTRAVEKGRVTPAELKDAVRGGGTSIGRLMLAKSALPSIPELPFAATSALPLHAAASISEEDRTGLAEHAAELLRLGVMRHEDLVAKGPGITALDIIVATTRALARHVRTVNERALATSPFGECSWAPFYFDFNGPVSTGSEHPINVCLTIADTIVGTAPKLSSPMLQSALLLAQTELARQSRYGLVVDIGSTLEVVSPWLWEQVQDLMIDMRWKGRTPIFDQKRLREFRMEWEGQEDIDVSEPVSEDVVELVRYMRNVARRPKVTSQRLQKTRQAVAKLQGKDARLVQGVFDAAALLAKRPPLRIGTDVLLDNDVGAAHPCLFALDPDLQDWGVCEEALDSYGSEGVATYLSAPWGKTAQFVTVLEDVVLEASIISDAMSAIAFHG